MAWGGEQAQLEALEYYELDLVIGGFTDSTPWSTYVDLTAPYFEERIEVGVPRSTQPPSSLKGLEVSVPRDDSSAAFL